MKKFIYLTPLAFFFLAWLYAYEQLLWMIKVIIFIVIVLSLIGAYLAIAIGRERLKVERANRCKKEAEAEEAKRKAEIQIVTAGNQVFISDLNHDAWWRSAHLDYRFYGNSQNTYEPLSETEQIENWRQWHAPRTIEKPSAQLPQGEIEQSVETLADLIDTYPHLMLIGGTGSGKTQVVSQVIGYHLSKNDLADVIWLSTHTSLDIEAGNIHPRAHCVQEPDEILQALKDILGIYTYRRKNPKKSRQIIVAMDEWPELIAETDGAGDILKRLSRGTRKVGINLILASHGGTVNDLGIAGSGSVKHDFAEVYLYPKLTQKNQGVWQPFNKASRIEVELFGPFYCNGRPKIARFTAPQPTPEEQELIEMYRENASMNEMANFLFGSTGGNQNKKIKEILAKFGM